MAVALRRRSALAPCLAASLRVNERLREALTTGSPPHMDHELARLEHGAHRHHVHVCRREDDFPFVMR